MNQTTCFHLSSQYSNEMSPNMIYYFSIVTPSGWEGLTVKNKTYLHDYGKATRIKKKSCLV